MDNDEKNTIYQLIAELQETVIAIGEDLQRTKSEIFFLKAKIFDLQNTKQEVKK